MVLDVLLASVGALFACLDADLGLDRGERRTLGGQALQGLAQGQHLVHGLGAGSHALVAFTQQAQAVVQAHFGVGDALTGSSQRTGVQVGSGRRSSVLAMGVGAMVVFGSGSGQRQGSQRGETGGADEEAEMLYSYIGEIQFADPTNREGHAAKVYFNALFGLDFTRTEENSINAALNYGYSLLLSAFNRCITANGYLTQLGLFHDNMFNPFNLASDLMEPYRTIVDWKVKAMQPNKFEHDEKMEVVGILQKEVQINGRNEFLNNAIKIYCKSIFDAINQEDLAEIKFYKYEF